MDKDILFYEKELRAAGYRLIAGTDGEYGLYVLTVDGETVDEANQEWWGYTKGGEMVEYGVDMCPIADGEHYEFTLNVGW